MIRYIGVCLLILHCVNGQAVSAICEESGTAGSFDVIFKYDRQGTTTATGLESYMASEDPNFDTKVTGSGCTTTTLTNDIYTIAYTVNTANALPCGVQQGSPDTSKYHFAISPFDVVDKVYTFSCDIDNLQIPVVVENSNFYTEHLNAQVTQRQNDDHVMFHVITADGYHAPVSDVELGQPIQLRLIYDNGLFDRKPDMCGMKFILARTPSDVMAVQIFTKGLGTRVHITGTNSNDPIDITKVVKRERPVVVTISKDYQPFGNAGNWQVSESGVQVEAVDEPVCVRVKEYSPDGIYTVYPDHFLGTSYRAVDYLSIGSSAARLLVTAIEDGTVVTLDLSSYTIAGLTIDGDVAAASTPVSLGALETLKITCDDCGQIVITSSKKIALVVTNSITASYAINQIPDTNYLDQEFLSLPRFDFASYGLTVLMSTATTSGSGSYSTKSASSVAFSDEVRFNRDYSRISVSVPVYNFQFYDIDLGCSPMVLFNPGRRQWNTHYDIDVLHDETADATIVMIMCRSSDIGTNIYIRSDTTDEILVPSYSITRFEVPASGIHPKEHRFIYADLSITEDGHYVVYTKDVTTPFYLALVDKMGTTCVGYMSFGITFADINPCVPSVDGFPDNKYDDDCDTFNDEELQDGIDNDGDGLIDEDLAIFEDFVKPGVIVRSLIVANNPGFTGASVEIVHVDGCNVIQTGDTHASIGPFSKNNDLNSVFDDLWVTDTPMFRAYRYKASDDVYFRVAYEFCYGGAAACEESCDIDRRKRSTIGDLHHTDFKLTVSNSSYGDTKEKKAWRCTAAKIYWVPHVILLLIIVIEVATTAYFLYVKYKLKRD